MEIAKIRKRVEEHTDSETDPAKALQKIDEVYRIKKKELKLRKWTRTN